MSSVMREFLNNAEPQLISFKNCKRNECISKQFDIKYAYPWITKETKDKTINITELHTNKHVEIIKHCKKSILFHKKSSLYLKDW